MNRMCTAVLAVIVCLGSAATASAYQSTTQMYVSLTKEQPQVTVIATPLNFGSVTANAGIFATSTITVNATANTSYQIALDRGSNLPGPGQPTDVRYLQSAMGQIQYYVYSDPGRTTLWGDDGATLPAPSVGGVGTGTDQTYDVHGLAIVDASSPAGDYTDVVTVTVLF